MRKNNFIIIILIILLIALIGFGIAYSKAREARLQTGKPITPDVDPKEDGILNLSGVSVFFDKSTGTKTSSEVGHYVTDLMTEYVPSLIDNLRGNDSDEELETYYNENEEQLKNEFGVETVESFKGLYRILSSKKIDYKQYNRLMMDYDSFIDHNDNTPKQYYDYVKCKVYYIDDSVIDFDLYVRFRDHYKYPTYIADFK